MVGNSDSTSKSEIQSPSQNFFTGFKPFNQRVRVLMEVANSADEIEVVKNIFQSMGWTVRSATKSEAHVYPTRDRVWLVVEVRFSGYPKTAPKAAVKRIEEVTGKFELGAWVRYAELVAFSKEPESTFYIYENFPERLAQHKTLTRGLEKIGIARIAGLIRLPLNAQENEARLELKKYDLGQPFDLSRNSISQADPDSPERLNRTASPVHIRIAQVVAGCTFAFLFGASSVWASGIFKPILALLGIAMAALIAQSILNGKLMYRFFVGFIFSIVLDFAGAFVANGTPKHDPFYFWGYLATALAVILIARGAFFALTDSGIDKHASWLFPLIITVLVPFLLALGGTFDTEYLTYGFGIPSSIVSTPVILRIAIAGRSILFGLVIILLIVAIIGWVRYFNGFDNFTRRAMLPLAIAIAMLYLLTSISTGLSWVDSAAQSAAAKAHAGQQPPAYFGIQGVLECVRPINNSLPVYNGPLPNNRPVVSFGTTSTELWVWDPKSGQAIGVPLEDVDVTPATGRPAHC